ncbi:MAG: 4Fe-4S binding protein, partial [Candidatus Verstraetearchaeota archaeon]|nr:4Fe-4S binding protein [Candidatus Verstraetearchaeota archaeon]
VKRLVPRISFDKNRCVKCGECSGICPEGAIEMVEYPVVDDSKCIRCYACYEICEYNAVKIKQKALPL